MNDLHIKEKKLKEALMLSNLTLDELEELKSSPEIKRYLSLVAIIARHQEHQEFKTSNEASQNSSKVKEILLAIGLFPCF